MKSIITVAALSLALTGPAFAQQAAPAATPPLAPAAKPAEAPKIQPAAAKGATTEPQAKPGDAKTGKDSKDAKKVDPKAAVPTTPAVAPQAGTQPKADAGKAAPTKTEAAKTTEKPAETKKQ